MVELLECDKYTLPVCLSLPLLLVWDHSRWDPTVVT